MKEIQWFPGHMAKAEREITKALSQTDLVLELLDARVPLASRNPDLARLCHSLPTVLLLNKADLASEEATARFLAYYKHKGLSALACNAKTGEGLSALKSLSASLLRAPLAACARKGIRRPMRAIVVGVPNVGKSALINRLCASGKTKVENRPGVTRNLSWTRTNIGFDLLDTPGVLWPKFASRATGESLAFIGSVREEVLSAEEIAAALLVRLNRLAPEALSLRYGIEATGDVNETLQAIAKKRGMLLSGGVPDIERAAKLLLDETRAGKLGRLTLESVPD